MKLLVTGGCGFIGSAFCRRLQKQHPYMTLVNLDYLYPCSTVAADLTVTAENYVFVKGDIKDRALLDRLMVDHQIDTVVHFAAQSHVDTSFTNPMLYTQDNVIGTHTLLEACRAYGKVSRFIHISTDEVYGENHSQGGAVFTETSLLKPTNPYAASKASAEMFVHSYIHSYNMPIIVIRSNNVYGPGQYPEKVIPKFMFQLLDGKKLTLQGTGNQLRSFLYVEDAVDAVLCVLFQGEVGEIYNISSKDELSIRDLAKQMLAVLSPDERLEDRIVYVEDRHFNDKRYWIESEPLKKLGWKQRVSFDEGLRTTIDWFRTVNRAAYWVTKENLLEVTTPIRKSEMKRLVCLLYGGNGWIGSLFRPVLEAKGFTVVLGTSRADNRVAVDAEIASVNPSHVVSLIGRTHGPGFGTIDYLEQPGKLRENLNDNLYGPLVLAAAAAKAGCHMLYMGTGCIFEYDESHTVSLSPLGSEAGSVGFTEESLPNFFGSGYSTVKGYTDRLMGELYGGSALNVRIRMPISSQDGPRNFISKIIAYKNICSIQNSMTVMDDVLPALADCMIRRDVGTLNAVNPGTMDHNTILTMYRDIQNPKHVWNEISNKELVSGFVKGARSNNYLETNRIESLCPTIPTLESSVRRILTENRFAGRKSDS
uniref:NAD(P)-binding domain-containing protein n=1 Tax=viral metagenome TaxID=1070528 RepID=A0A6C0AQN2_9ZZZZ